MIEYYEQLMNEEQEELTGLIQLLYRQTFVLERKYERRTGRFVLNRDFRVADRHLEFLKAYFAVAGITVCESSHMGLIYLQGETLLGEKLPRLATIYLLILKLVYDEQMAQASSSVQVYTSLGEINAKAGEFGLMRGAPSPTEIRRAVTLLKRYQIVEPLELLEDLGGESRMIIYPSVNAVLMGDDARALLATFRMEDGELPTEDVNLEEAEEQEEAKPEETVEQEDVKPGETVEQEDAKPGEMAEARGKEDGHGTSDI